ncbi:MULTISPECIES: DUF6247 family protein [Streptomyces]|uniref:Uncharacterized protein n=1 Tax=Streptomyces odorifer TaxID=53450 RepID=A0A7Y6CC32_9ACTN|nr:DUF6247 family protein [Streptomyces odorifer]NUV30781.1 hypothetical protein [Streptomyces odorifer]NUV38092.1 hypothetical protein [Streptomyces sp. KAI-27]NUV45670.1 hypothetical protein [Streptomyces sp. CAI-78]
MSAQPEEAPAPPAPTEAARLRAQIAADRRADSWGLAFDRDWAKALAESGQSYSLAPLHNVVRTWQHRLAAAPDVDAYLDAGRIEAGFVDLDDVVPRR